MNAPSRPLSRRTFLQGVTASSLVGSRLHAETPVLPKGKAQHCIFLWLGGGMAQIDTFDPKGRGDAAKKIPGCYYRTIPTAVPDVRVCEHLRRTAPLIDRVTILRTVHHDVIDEHGAAVIRVHTGRPTSGTIQYPSLGSIVAHERGSLDSSIPPYVVAGYPNIARDPGFLGPKFGYLYTTDTQSGPRGLSRPPHVSPSRQTRRRSLLDQLRHADPSLPELRPYHDVLTQSLDLAGPEFMDVFDLKQEPAQVRERYGGEFGQRCLLSRRLVERGVRFVEVAHNLNFMNGTGWDTHFKGQLKQHLLINELDQALAALLTDLEERNRLDQTLVVVATEFGRPAHFDAKGGRGHYGRTFSMVLAGGGLHHHGAYGETDERAMKIVSDPVSIPDFLATICACLGIDPGKELYAGDRPVPITDRGRPIQALFG